MTNSQAMPLLAGVAKPWHRVISTLVLVLGFGLVALVMHEFFHFVALRALGGEGYITFHWGQGFTHFTNLPDQLWVVQLSGGLLTGIFLLVVFWFWAWSSRTLDNMNVEVAAFGWALGNVVYAPMEIVTSSPIVGAVAFGMGFGIAGAIYFTKLMNWLAGGGQTLDRASYSVADSQQFGPLQTGST